jgi:hypothetical protein
VLSASKGQLKSERAIDSNGHPGLDIEVLPPQGAIIKARIYATSKQVFEIAVHCPQNRVASEDVEKFLDSFQFTQP